MERELRAKERWRGYPDAGGSSSVPKLPRMRAFELSFRVKFTAESVA